MTENVKIKEETSKQEEEVAGENARPYKYF